MNAGSPRALSRLTFLFRSGRRARLEKSHEMPTEFFYGFVQLKEQGYDVRYLEDFDLGIAPPLPAFARLLNKASRLIADLPVGLMWLFVTSGRGRDLDSAGVVVATTNSLGLTLAFGKALGLVRAPVLLLAMGLLVKKPGLFKRRVLAWLLQHVRIACISTAEQSYLSQMFPTCPVHYVPFGVDQNFWRPSHGLSAAYVLAIGNDPMRDWSTLVSAWTEELPRLKIVTNLRVPPGASNIEVIRGDWRAQVLTDEAIRDLYQAALFVVVPLRDTLQPSGQSVSLQAMACGKAVIVSDIAGLWNRDLMVDGETVLLTPPGDSGGLRDRAMRLASDADLAGRLGSAGRRVVESQLNTTALAAALIALAGKSDA